MTVRCHAEPESWTGEEIVLSAAESHHLKHVMRIRPGDEVVVMDGAGREAPAMVAGEHGRALLLKILSVRRHPRPDLAIHLLSAVLKGPKMDWLVQKATELGAASLLPVQMARCVVRLNERQAADRCERWRQIAQGGIKQCGTPFLPVIGPVTDFAGALTHAGAFDILLICSLGPDARSLRAVLGDAHARGVCSVGVLVGPEGDFTSGEIAAALSADAVPVTLGAQVLRAETASVFALGAIQYEWMSRS
ncbi:MAG TPA: RsmE family RNA methyltransferase [Kiritimatiellia bacterium]|nr:RsmE family RNA methyltransferase [Kiritimatiellia bacterium]HPA78267.1 RsmE family RNA methyltransferase [Kiritimatiellia bacterium]HQQ04745.1 RsmE family RNA methyltransferase [Kiritimatiellia bacterium]